jgi:hypothetical protein
VKTIQEANQVRFGPITQDFSYRGRICHDIRTISVHSCVTHIKTN